MTTPRNSCPSCQENKARFLAGVSHEAVVDYFRCEGCGHVWAILKDGSGEIRHVLPLKDERRPEG